MLFTGTSRSDIMISCYTEACFKTIKVIALSLSKVYIEKNNRQTAFAMLPVEKRIFPKRTISPNSLYSSSPLLNSFRS